MKTSKVTAIGVSYLLAFFLSWFMNRLVHTYIPAPAIMWVQISLSALMLVLLLSAVNFFDRF